MEEFDSNSIVFQHLIELPNCDCVFCSTVDTSTGKTKLFLVFNERERIYVRNGSKDTWDEVKDINQYTNIKNRYNQTVSSQQVPCFAA